MEVPDYVENAIDTISESIDRLADSMLRLSTEVQMLREDVEQLYDSQDMNVWVLVRGIQTGQISADRDPQEVLRSIAQLQREYEAVMSVFEFLRAMSDRT